MSLVGSLEDLGLGEILQIISLSGKSGLLQLRADGGQGRILFDDGRIRLAFIGPKEPTRASMGVADPATGGDGETAVREWVERSVFQMFSWSAGEFSFEVCDVREHGAPDLFLDPGINPQFLALEGTRIADERAAGMPDQGMGFGAPLPGQAVVVADPADEGGSGGSPLDIPPESVAEEAKPLAARPIALAAEPIAEGWVAEAPAPSEPALTAQPTELPPLVLVDPDLAVVEWARASLPDGFPGVHLFQSTDQGIHRIRQYLRRAEVPLVVLSTALPPDALSGARTPEELLARLQKQAPQMRILLLEETGRPLPAALDALGVHRARLSKPTASQLADPRQWDGLVRLGREFANGLLGACGLKDPSVHEGTAVEELRQASDELRHSTLAGEVLPKVLEFARRTFSRVALFMIRDELAQGIAQVGLPLAGGPSDEGFCGREFPVAESSWLSRVVAERAPLRVALESPPERPGDQRFLELLGQGVPREAWFGPILSTDRVLAVMYADQLPNQASLGDTAALEVILHHAGLALDRAALERALSDPAA